MILFERNRKSYLSFQVQLVVGVLLLLFLLLPASIFAQVGKSGITGTVSDSTGAAVPNAKITVKNEATNLESTANSGDTGAYMIRNLVPGSYTVTAEVIGFQKAIIEHVLTEVEKISSVDITLNVGRVEQTVSVEATPSLITTTSGTVGNLVTQKEIETLPLNGRSWVSLNFLTPGAVPFHGGTASAVAITISVAPSNFTVNGLRGGNNLYLIDGANLEVVATQVLGILPPLDALSEFRTQTGNYSAEYIGGAAAAVSAATKSGTNKIHGSAYEYIRNDKLDARNFFDAQTGTLKRNQFGVSLGGPIRKDKTFGFFAWEGFRQRKSSTFVGDFPTADQRSGNLSGFPTQITDPLTGEPFAGNIIPSNRIDQFSANYLNNWIPLPNTNVPVGQGNYHRSAPVPLNWNSYVGRVDHKFSDKSSLFVRYLYTRSDTSTPTFDPHWTFTRFDRSQDYALEYNRTISNTLLLQGRFSANRSFHSQLTGNDKSTDMLKEWGIPLGTKGFTSSPDSAQHPLQINVSGFTTFGPALFGRPQDIYDWSYFYDVLLFATRGSHAMKMGGGVRRIFVNFPESINPTGQWTFNGYFSGLGLGDYLLGYPRSMGSLPGIFHQDAWRWAGGVWFQDDWKVTRKLTLNLGMRWDIDGRYVSHSGTVSNFDLSNPPTAVQIFPRVDAEGCPVGGCPPLPAGWSRALVDGPQKNLFGPRIGFAQRVRENTVLRGGYGIYWQPMTADQITIMSLNAPFVGSINATFDFPDLATFNPRNPFAAVGSAVSIGAFAAQKDWKDGYNQQWNLTLEHTIGANLLAVGYVGNKGTHLNTWNTNLNTAAPGPGPIQPRVPFTNIGPISYHDSSRDANYNALQVKAQRRFARGLSFTVGYAWAKAINSGDGTYIEQNVDLFQQGRNPRAERALAGYDVRHALTFSYIYALPFGNGMGGAAGKVVGGWQLEGITSLFSGSRGATVFNSYDNLNNGGGFSYPDLICNPDLGGGRSSGEKVQEFFKTACFVPAGGGTLGVPNYTYGNANRHPVTGPGVQTWDFALQKNTNVTEWLRVEFRAEFFNMFNHPNFGFPNTTFGTPQFGRIFSASDPREIQFGLRLVF